MSEDRVGVAAAGFAVVPDVLEPAEIEILARALERERNRAAPGMRGLLEKVPEIQHLYHCDRVRSLLEPILDPSAKPVRGLFFDKTANANWGVAWHQDTTIAVRQRLETPGFYPWSLKDGIPHVRPPAAILEGMLTLRLHLDDTDCDNGCLWVVPGSHRFGFLEPARLQALKAQAIPLSVAKGGILLMKPLLLHASYRAKQPKQRRVIHLEFAAEELPGDLEWYSEACF